MGKAEVLNRVAADLARGSTHRAIQRLSGLVAAYPTDLDLRRRLAAAYRRAGNRIQAGRWDYLTIGADRRDTAAFERAFPSAVARLRELHWPHHPAKAATAYARARLEKLVAAAAAERSVAHAARAARATLRRSASGRRYLWARAGAAVAAVPRVALLVAVPVVGFFVALGAATVVTWFVR
ncbi:MAG: DUF6584 family protein [Micromonosporaceae bacterium]|jgi:hypothetical protein